MSTPSTGPGNDRPYDPYPPGYPRGAPPIPTATLGPSLPPRGLQSDPLFTPSIAGATAPNPVHPAAAGLVAPPAAPRRGRAVPVLGVLVGLLLIGEGVLAAGWVRARGTLDRQLRFQNAQATADAADSQLPGAMTQPTLDTAAVRAALTAVQDADKAVDAAIVKWATVDSTPFEVVGTAMDSCYFLVDRYDRSTAPFSASQLSPLPQKVDLTNAKTDCGRASLPGIKGTLK